MGRATPLTDEQSRFAAGHIGLATHFARVFSLRLPAAIASNRGDDIKSEAVLGLIDAAKNNDPARAPKFSTFAYACMRRRVLDEMRVADRRRDHHKSCEIDSLQRADGAISAMETRLDAESLLGLHRKGRDLDVARRYYLDGLSMKEIAAEYGVTVSWVSAICARVVREIRSKVARTGE